MGLKYAKKRKKNRNSTKSRKILRAKNLKPLIIILAACLAVVAVAVIWGNALGRRADSYEASKNNGEWVLDEDDATPPPQNVPITLSSPLTPAQTFWDVKTYDGRGCDGVTLNVYSDGAPNYYSDVGIAANLSDSDMYSLPKKVKSMHENGYRVTCVFYIDSLSSVPAGSDSAVQSYKRGIELALIEEFALSGADEILLVGCPITVDGADGGNQRTFDFLRELGTRLSAEQYSATAPAIGVALSIEVINGIYWGNTAAATVLSQCDFLAMDMRNADEYPLFGGSTFDYVPVQSEDEDDATSPLNDMLKRFSYAYQQYPLRLMFTDEQRAEIVEALSHGFFNISVIK